MKHKNVTRFRCPSGHHFRREPYADSQIHSRADFIVENLQIGGRETAVGTLTTVIRPAVVRRSEVGRQASLASTVISHLPAPVSADGGIECSPIDDAGLPCGQHGQGQKMWPIPRPNYSGLRSKSSTCECPPPDRKDWHRRVGEPSCEQRARCSTWRWRVPYAILRREPAHGLGASARRSRRAASGRRSATTSAALAARHRRGYPPA